MSNISPNEQKKLDLLTRLAMLPIGKLEDIVAKVEREKANQLAKAAKKPGRRSFEFLSNPLDNR